MKPRLLLFIFIAFANVCSAQAVLEGTLRNEASEPIAGATIRLLNTHHLTRTDSGGFFQLTGLSPATYTIQLMTPGYADRFQLAVVQIGSNQIELVQTSITKSLETVVVTAQKKEELLQRMPLSITALTGRKTEEYRLWSISDLTALSSNFYAAHPGDGRNVGSIRGIVNTSYDQAIATYVDGVNQFGLDTYIPHLFDVERIEVLKGPQGTLYGRNAMGGVINIITKKPGNYTDGFMQLSIGNYGQQRYSAGIRTPVVKDKLFAGAAGLYDRTRGFYTNEYNNSNYDKRHNIIGNYYLRYTPTTQWAFTLNAKHNSNRNNGAFPLVFGVDEALNNPYRLAQNAATKMIDNVFNSSLSITYSGAAVHLTSQTAYQSNHRYYTNPIDADFSTLDAISIINNYGNEWNKIKVWTQEINLRSATTSNNGLTWLAGTYLFHQDNPVKQATRFGEQAQLVGAPDNNFSLVNTSKGKGSGVAVYGKLSYAFTKKIELTAGLRYDHEKKEQKILGEYQKDPDPNPMFAYRSDTMANANFSAWSPKATLTFYPNDKQTVYASFGRGFRAGGLTPLSSDPSQPALYPFRPEFSKSAELGWKHTLLQQKLIFNLAFFHTTLSDVQLPTLVLPDAVTITRNTGRLVSKGIEVEIRAAPFKSLAIDYNFGYTDARYASLKVSQNGSEVDLKDKRQIFTPDVTSMFTAQYTYPLGNNASLLFRGEWKYLGTQYFDLANAILQPSYHLFNTRLGIMTYKTSEVVLWGRNLTGQRYISYAYDFGAVHLGDPRSYGITIGLKF
ncbi:MAG TPA: TonB-dependent receptor [Flavisolibacter sp.]|jgi:iron complex outermembrane receptor protein|nr:TonB-dependent receptor [Flavisolibacter sp.]